MRLGIIACALVGMAASCSSEEVDLSGSYSMTVPDTGFEGADPGQFAPEFYAGAWTLEIDGTSYQLEGEGFGRITGRIVEMDGVVRFEDTPAPVGAFNCFTEEGARLSTRAESKGIYSYELEEESLT